MFNVVNIISGVRRTDRADFDAEKKINYCFRSHLNKARLRAILKQLSFL